MRRILATFRIAALFGLCGLVLLALAIMVASARYGACGPSAVDAAVAACRTGARVLLAAYALLSVALVAGAASLSLLWRLRRRRSEGR